ncbi:hypothetical protein MMC19_000210 [Ptychographa xylographoides]|nr:hypothetical protein [Ptychographa xylographoides]
MASDISSGISTFIKILELTYQLKAVDEQTRDLLRTTTNFARDLRQARSLRRARGHLLSDSDKVWMDESIKAAEVEFREVEKLIDPARVDMSTKNSIDLTHRVLWVFRDNPKVHDKHRGLQISHQSLSTVIGVLYSRDVTVVVSGIGDESSLSHSHDPEISHLYSWRNLRHQKSASSFRAHAERPARLEESTIVSDNIQTTAQGPSASPRPLAHLTPDQPIPHMSYSGFQPIAMPYTPPISPPSLQLAGGQYIPPASVAYVHQCSLPLTPMSPQALQCEPVPNVLPYPEDSTTRQAYEGGTNTTVLQNLQMPTPPEPPRPEQPLQKTQYFSDNRPNPFTQPLYQPTFFSPPSPSHQFYPGNLSQVPGAATYLSEAPDRIGISDFPAEGPPPPYARVPESNNPQRRSTVDRRQMRAAWFAHQNARGDFDHLG